jgi:hypothetical protein
MVMAWCLSFSSWCCSTRAHQQMGWPLQMSRQWCWAGAQGRGCMTCILLH